MSGEMLSGNEVMLLLERLTRPLQGEGTVGARLVLDEHGVWGLHHMEGGLDTCLATAPGETLAGVGAKLMLKRVFQMAQAYWLQGVSTTTHNVLTGRGSDGRQTCGPV